MATFDNAVGKVALNLKNRAACTPALHHLLVELEPEWDQFAMSLRDEGLLVSDEDSAAQDYHGHTGSNAVLAQVTDLLAADTDYVVSFEYPGFICVQLNATRQASIGDNGDVGENLGFQLDDMIGNNIDAFTIEANIDSPLDVIVAAIVSALEPYK